MNFNQRPLPSSADLTGKSFVALLEVLRSTDKQKEAMAELLAFQAEVQENLAAARKELEAVNVRSQELAAAEQEIKKQYAVLDQVSAQVKSGQVKFEEQRAKVEAMFAAREAELEDKALLLDRAALAAADREKQLEAGWEVLDKEKLGHLAFWTEETKKLEVREAAVAAREAKAEELAKLLKGV